MSSPNRRDAKPFSFALFAPSRFYLFEPPRREGREAFFIFPLRSLPLRFYLFELPRREGRETFLSFLRALCAFAVLSF